MNERMQTKCLLENVLLLSSPPSSSTLPGGLLSFVEGAVREAGKQEQLIVSQGVGLPARVGGLNSSTQSLPGMLFGAYAQYSKSGLLSLPAHWAVPPSTWGPSPALSELLSLKLSPHCATSWGTQALNPTLTTGRVLL